MRHIVNIGTLFAPQARFDARLPAWRLPGWLDRKPRHGVKNMPNHRGSFNPEPTATVIRLATGERLRLRLRIKRWVSYRLGLLCDLLRRGGDRMIGTLLGWCSASCRLVEKGDDSSQKCVH